MSDTDADEPRAELEPEAHAVAEKKPFDPDDIFQKWWCRYPIALFLGGWFMFYGGAEALHGKAVWAAIAFFVLLTWEASLVVGAIAFLWWAISAIPDTINKMSPSAAIVLGALIIAYAVAVSRRD